MAKKGGTVFQALDKAITGNWKHQEDAVTPHINSYDMSGKGNDVIFRTNDKEEYLSKKLELQQNKYLKDRWVKANVNLSVTAYAGLNNIKLMYRDADLMDAFPEIGAALDTYAEEACLHGSTKIKLLNGSIKTISELYNNNYKDFWVYAVDENGNFSPSKVERVINKGEKELYKITLDDGTEIKCTDNHKWLLSSNDWVETKDLTKGDSLMSLYDNLNYKGYERVKSTLESKFNLTHRVVAEYNHKVVSVEKLGIFETVYDLVNSSCNNCFGVKCNKGQIISHNCISNDEGNVVNVYSKSDRIKSILQDLFVNRLNIQLTAPMIVRAMCKYGNQFMLLDIDNKNGVKGWRQLPVFNMERIENGIQNPYGMGASIAVNGITKDDADMSTQFIWLDDNNSQVPFRDWQIGHFRLLTNSLYLPYGVSALNAARRHWRMLSLMEDMMLIYRLERSVERRVYKIFVGAIDDADVQGYVEQIANQFKRTPIVDPMTGQIDLRKNILPVHKDTPIPLLDGRTIKINELAKEYEEGKDNYVYSIQDGTHKIVPGKVIWCGKNYTADKLYKITLDDDSHMILAGEHEIIMRDGKKKRADEVSVGESVMPLYREVDKNSKKLFDRYERVYNPNSGKYEFTHRLIASEVHKEDDSYNTVHHKDFNKYNNNPNNLLWMDYYEHHKMHGDLSRTMWNDPIKRKERIEKLSKSCIGRKVSEETKEKISKSIQKKYDNGEFDFVRKLAKENMIEYNKSDKHREIARETGLRIGYREGFRNYNESELHTRHNEIRKIASKNSWIGEGRTNRIQKMNIHFDSFIWDALHTEIVNHRITKRKEMLDYINSNLIDHIIKINNNKRLEHNGFISRGVLEGRIKDIGFSTITEYINASLKNHKVKSIEIVGGDDVYCMTVVGLNGEEDRHNFALTTWKSDGSLNESGVFVSNCIDNDIFLPVRDENAPTPIDTLSAGQNLTAMDDIKFVQNKVLTALRIPKTFLNFEENAGDGKNLALMDIRFTRLINRIQQAFLMELTKIASIHLFLLGFNDELNNFTLSMNNPSTQAESLEIENMQKKIDAVRDAVSDPGNGLPVMSQTRALKQIMKWSEKDIKENLEEIRLEKGIVAELEKTTQIIKKTGIFDTVDRIYGEPGAEYTDDAQGGGQQDGIGGDMGGGGGMPPAPMGGEGDLGGELDGLGAPGSNDTGDISGQEGSMPTADMGQDANAPMESVNKNKPLIVENYFDKYLNEITKGKNSKNEIGYKRADIYDSESLLINEEFDKMINALSKFVDEK